MTAPGLAKGGSGELKVDGKVVATGKQANSITFLQVSDETFDVGVDTRTGVNDKDYQVPFAFTGMIDKLTIKLGAAAARRLRAKRPDIDDRHYMPRGTVAMNRSLTFAAIVRWRPASRWCSLPRA